jgi:zinc protease
VGLTYPTGVIRREVRRGVEPKAETQLIFTGPYQFTRENLHVLSSLTDVLEIRLRERLREALGGTYGVSVDASPQRVPRQTYEIRIDFGSAPERAAELTRAVFAEIDSLKRNGPSEKDLQKVRETQLRERETNLRRNGFWAGLIYSYDFNGWDLGLIPKYTDEVRALDTKTLRDAARRYFDEKRYVEVRLMPER